MNCRVCNDGDGRTCTLRFEDPAERITIRLCETCRLAFAEEPELRVARTVTDGGRHP
ncbi:MAG: hypothetical protein ABEH56_03535 [Salinirussus sp.]